MQGNGQSDGMCGVPRQRVEREAKPDLQQVWGERLRMTRLRSLIIFALSGFIVGVQLTFILALKLSPAMVRGICYSAVALAAAAQLVCMFKDWRDVQKTRREFEQMKADLDKAIEEAGLLKQWLEERTNP